MFMPGGAGGGGGAGARPTYAGMVLVAFAAALGFILTSSDKHLPMFVHVLRAGQRYKWTPLCLSAPGKGAFSGPITPGGRAARARCPA